MEFKFNVSDIFPGPIAEINQSLIPPGFTGDRRALWDVVGKVSEIVNSMGDASAAAQGLTKPITTADRLRNSEQTIYLLVDRNAKNGKGVVTGMLKTGKKSLYVFDRDGHHYQVSPPCVLDFYVHESRQRTGLGKQLFEHMLQVEKVEPVKMAVDRPSEKLLSFLDKHYGLNSALRQMNNYVVFDGFFPEPQIQSINGDGGNSESPSKAKSANGLQANYTSPYGRYGAPRPPCSMGQIIHNQSPVQSNEPSGVSLNQKIKTTTQSTPAIQSQQRQINNSNQGYTDVCQSAPNVHYQQAQQPMMQQQQQQQNVVCPYSNIPHQHQYPNIMQTQQAQPMYEHQHENIQLQQQPNVSYNNGISPREEEERYNENLYIKDPYKTDPQKYTASQANIPVHHQEQGYPPQRQISQPQVAHTGSTYSVNPTQQQYQQQQQQFIGNQVTTTPQRGGGAGVHQHVTAAQQVAPGYQEMLVPQTPVHAHQMVSSQQHVAPSHHHVHSQQTLPPQETLHHVQTQQMIQAVPSQHPVPAHHHSVPAHQHSVPAHQHIQSQQMVAPLQTAPSQHSIPAHQHVQSQQVMHQTTPSHHHIQPQQVVSPHHHVPSQHAMHSHPQEMVTSPREGVSHHHVAHTHPQQMVTSPQEAGHSHHHAHTVAPEQTPPDHHHHVAQSMPVVAASTQQQPHQLQSMPAMQPAHGNVQYQQQYVQPPNTEQPVHVKTHHHNAAPQTVKTVPYQYYDSSLATMQTGYSQPQPSPIGQNMYTQQISQAAGDMSTVQKSSDYQQSQQQNSGRVGTSGQSELLPPPPIHRRKVPQETVGSLLQDGSGEQRIQLQGQQFNGEQHKALDDSVSQSPKLERPRSLSIQRSEESENVDKKITNDVKSGVHYKESENKSADELDNIENDVEKVEIAEKLNAANSSEKNSVDDSDDRSKSPNPLTAQGFFDLKFYHSRLW